MSDPQHFNPSDASDASLDQAIADLLVLSVWELRQTANRAFEPLGLTSFQVALLNLIAHDPLLRSGQLAERLGVIQVSVSQMTTELEGRGLLVRVIPQEDQRRRTLSLTEAGEALRGEANALWAAVTVNRYGTVSRRNKETFLKTLQAIHAAIKPDEL